MRRVEPASVISDRFVIGVGALGVMHGGAGEFDRGSGVSDRYGQAPMTSPFRKQALVVGPAYTSAAAAHTCSSSRRRSGSAPLPVRTEHTRERRRTRHAGRVGDVRGRPPRPPPVIRARPAVALGERRPASRRRTPSRTSPPGQERREPRRRGAGRAGRATPVAPRSEHRTSCGWRAGGCHAFRRGSPPRRPPHASTSSATSSRSRPRRTATRVTDADRSRSASRAARSSSRSGLESRVVTTISSGSRPARRTR